MPPNLFKGFKLFEAEQEEEEKDKDPTSMVDIAKKQFHIPKKCWLGMPILLSNTKIGEHKIVEPTMFYVWDFDNNTVTLKNVMWAPEAGAADPGEEEDDPDDEIDLDDNDLKGVIELPPISKDDFFAMQKPQGMQAGGAAGGGMGGMGGGMGGMGL